VVLLKKKENNENMRNQSMIQ